MKSRILFFRLCATTPIGGELRLSAPAEVLEKWELCKLPLEVFSLLPQPPLPCEEDVLSGIQEKFHIYFNIQVKQGKKFDESQKLKDR